MKNVVIQLSITPSQLLALRDLVAEHMQRPGHTEVFVDCATSIETTPDELLTLLLDTRGRVFTVDGGPTRE